MDGRMFSPHKRGVYTPPKRYSQARTKQSVRNASRPVSPPPSEYTEMAEELRRMGMVNVECTRSGISVLGWKHPETETFYNWSTVFVWEPDCLWAVDSDNGVVKEIYQLEGSIEENRYISRFDLVGWKLDTNTSSPGFIYSQDVGKHYKDGSYELFNKRWRSNIKHSVVPVSVKKAGKTFSMPPPPSSSEESESESESFSPRVRGVGMAGPASPRVRGVGMAGPASPRGGQSSSSSSSYSSSGDEAPVKRGRVSPLQASRPAKAPRKRAPRRPAAIDQATWGGILEERGYTKRVSVPRDRKKVQYGFNVDKNVVANVNIDSSHTIARLIHGILLRRKAFSERDGLTNAQFAHMILNLGKHSTSQHFDNTVKGEISTLMTKTTIPWLFKTDDRFPKYYTKEYGLRKMSKKRDAELVSLAQTESDDQLSIQEQKNARGRISFPPESVASSRYFYLAPIRGKGLGLFSRMNVGKGVNVGVFRGEMMYDIDYFDDTPQGADRAYADPPVVEYAVRLDPILQLVPNPRGDGGVAKYKPPRRKEYFPYFVNEPSVGESANCKLKDFVFKRENGELSTTELVKVLETHRAVKAGDELLVFYGKNYPRTYEVSSNHF
jgi:hypothetical protein